jgi:tetratricopeptide (TPR) repeat protein
LDSSDFVLAPLLYAEPKADLAADRKLLEPFREQSGREAECRLCYLQGRILQRQGMHAEATEAFREIVEGTDLCISAEPYLRLAESLALSGKPADAESSLRKALARKPSLPETVWRRWFEATAVDEGLDASGVLERWPAPAEARTDAWAADLHWALDLLARGETLRIDCGGGDSTDAKGNAWSRDRFFQGGNASNAKGGANGEDRVLKSYHAFENSSLGGPGYKIPVPRGRYGVTLQFLDSFSPDSNRRFDVIIEGNMAIENLSKADQEGEVPLVRKFDTEVKDGYLDIQFQARLGGPGVSAIEVSPRERGMAR